VTPHQAIAFVYKHGVVLESAKGSVPSLAEAIAGESIPGSWWAHPRSHEIFAATRAVRESKDVLVCRLVDGKVTFVHRKLWPALVRCAHSFPTKRIAQLSEHHTESGRHVTKQVPFPKWVPAQALESAASLSEEQARELLGSWVS
jgi:hypothetical protein